MHTWCYDQSRGDRGLCSHQKQAEHSTITTSTIPHNHSLVEKAIPSTKKSTELLSQTNGKRPGGLTCVPWQAGKVAACDVTVANTTADSHLSYTPVTPVTAGRIAIAMKEDKYMALYDSHLSPLPLSY